MRRSTSVPTAQSRACSFNARGAALVFGRRPITIGCEVILPASTGPQAGHNRMMTNAEGASRCHMHPWRLLGRPIIGKTDRNDDPNWNASVPRPPNIQTALVHPALQGGRMTCQTITAQLALPGFATRPAPGAAGTTRSPRDKTIPAALAGNWLRQRALAFKKACGHLYRKIDGNGNGTLRSSVVVYPK